MFRWLLPDHFADVLPPEGRAIERVRAQALGLLRSYGYEWVQPPLIEYVEALTAGAGQSVESEMFQLPDASTGKTLALRADMTTQVARIDAHILNRRGVTRLCYVGSVLRRSPTHLQGTCEPIQLGAELYGHEGLEADREIIELATRVVQDSGIAAYRIDFCHVAIVNALLALAPISASEKEEVVAALQAKDRAALARMSAAPHLAHFLTLSTLYGGKEVIAQARQTLPALASITQALEELERISALFPDELVNIDLADIRGYDYHSGLMFAIYCAGLSNPLVRGGRYNGIGLAFGRARAATGFSIDLRALVSLQNYLPAQSAIAAPWLSPNEDAALAALIAATRQQGEVVIALPPTAYQALCDSTQPSGNEYGCDRLLVQQKGLWTIQFLSTEL